MNESAVINESVVILEHEAERMRVRNAADKRGIEFYQTSLDEGIARLEALEIAIATLKAANNV